MLLALFVELRSTVSDKLNGPKGVQENDSLSECRVKEDVVQPNTCSESYHHHVQQNLPRAELYAPRTFSAVDGQVY